MQYTTRVADKPGEAHVNYQCPCGCTAGLMYDREAGSTHLGQCCCGRLLWLGTDAEGVVTARMSPDTEYEVDINDVTLPWGDHVTAALAVPVRSRVAAPVLLLDADEHLHQEHDHPHPHEHDHGNHDHHDHGHEHAHPPAAQRVKDVVCGMMIEPATAAATSVYRRKTYYFCNQTCKQRFDADPRRYAPAGGLFGWLRSKR